VSLPAEELLGGFGVRNATPTARRNVEAWLADAGLAVEPSLSANGLPESVTLVALEDPAGPQPPRGPAVVQSSSGVRSQAPSGSPPRSSARPPASTVRRRISTFLFVLGVLMITEAAITVTWQEPLSAILQARAQGTLENDLEELERAPISLDAQKRDELRAIRNDRKRLKRRLDLLASELAAKAKEGSAIGRVEIGRIDLSAVVVQGVSDPSLRKAPGHYPNTLLPGQGGTMGIAGHRTSYGAPFRHIDKLKTGDRITVTMPYGRFVYRVQGRRIVGAGDTEAFRGVTYQRLVLSACHPLYSAKQRILVFARLESRTPLGAGTIDETSSGRKMVVHRDPRLRYERQLERLGKRELAPGTQGRDVKELQRLLGVPQSGTYDAITQFAVRQFQQEHKLPADGVAGTSTKRLLARRPRPPSRPPTPPPVAPQAPTPEQQAANGQGQQQPPGTPPPTGGQPQQ
jgi:sortase A